MWIKLSLQKQCWNIESMKYMYTNVYKVDFEIYVHIGEDREREMGKQRD